MHTGVNIKGLEKILTASGIRHAFAGHGNHKLESERGQVGIVNEDFSPVLVTSYIREHPSQPSVSAEAWSSTSRPKNNKRQ